MPAPARLTSSIDVAPSQVAVKMIQKGSISDIAEVERVSREFFILTSLDHKNVIRLYEVLQDADKLYLIMEFAGGGSLASMLDKLEGGKMDEKSARRAFNQIVAALKYTHRKHVIHRDLKPENILLSTSNQIKVADFGLSNTVNYGGRPRTPVGTPLYAAPEILFPAAFPQLNAGESASAASSAPAGGGLPSLDALPDEGGGSSSSAGGGGTGGGPGNYNPGVADVWSCGVILYRMVSGRLPFQAESMRQLKSMILDHKLVLPTGISPQLESLLKGMLERDPLRRMTADDIAAHPWTEGGGRGSLPALLLEPLLETVHAEAAAGTDAAAGSASPYVSGDNGGGGGSGSARQHRDSRTNGDSHGGNNIAATGGLSGSTPHHSAHGRSNSVHLPQFPSGSPSASSATGASGGGNGSGALKARSPRAGAGGIADGSSALASNDGDAADNQRVDGGGGLRPSGDSNDGSSSNHHGMPPVTPVAGSHGPHQLAPLNHTAGSAAGNNAASAMLDRGRSDDGFGNGNAAGSMLIASGMGPPSGHAQQLAPLASVTGANASSFFHPSGISTGNTVDSTGSATGGSIYSPSTEGPSPSTSVGALQFAQNGINVGTPVGGGAGLTSPNGSSTGVDPSPRLFAVGPVGAGGGPAAAAGGAPGQRRPSLLHSLTSGQTYMHQRRASITRAITVPAAAAAAAAAAGGVGPATPVPALGSGAAGGSTLFGAQDASNNAANEIGSNIYSGTNNGSVVYAPGGTFISSGASSFDGGASLASGGVANLTVQTLLSAASSGGPASHFFTPPSLGAANGAINTGSTSSSASVGGSGAGTGAIGLTPLRSPVIVRTGALAAIGAHADTGSVASFTPAHASAAAGGAAVGIGIGGTAGPYQTYAASLLHTHASAASAANAGGGINIVHAATTGNIAGSGGEGAGLGGSEGGGLHSSSSQGHLPSLGAHPLAAQVSTSLRAILGAAGATGGGGAGGVGGNVRASMTGSTAIGQIIAATFTGPHANANAGGIASIGSSNNSSATDSAAGGSAGAPINAYSTAASVLSSARAAVGGVGSLFTIGDDGSTASPGALDANGSTSAGIASGPGALPMRRGSVPSSRGRLAPIPTNIGSVNLGIGAVAIGSVGGSANAAASAAAGAGAGSAGNAGIAGPSGGANGSAPSSSSMGALGAVGKNGSATLLTGGKLPAGAPVVRSTSTGSSSSGGSGGVGAGTLLTLQPAPPQRGTGGADPDSSTAASAPMQPGVADAALAPYTRNSSDGTAASPNTRVAANTGLGYVSSATGSTSESVSSARLVSRDSTMSTVSGAAAGAALATAPHAATAAVGGGNTGAGAVSGALAASTPVGAGTKPSPSASAASATAAATASGPAGGNGAGVGMALTVSSLATAADVAAASLGTPTNKGAGGGSSNVSAAGSAVFTFDGGPLTPSRRRPSNGIAPGTGVVVAAAGGAVLLSPTPGVLGGSSAGATTGAATGAGKQPVSRSPSPSPIRATATAGAAGGAAGTTSQPGSQSNSRSTTPVPGSAEKQLPRFMQPTAATRRKSVPTAADLYTSGAGTGGGAGMAGVVLDPLHALVGLNSSGGSISGGTAGGTAEPNSRPGSSATATPSGAASQPTTEARCRAGSVTLKL